MASNTDAVSTSKQSLMYTTVISMSLSQGISLVLSHVVNMNDGHILNKIAIISFIIQYVALIHASGNISFINSKRTEKYYDLTGSITYFLLIVYSLSNSFISNRQFNSFKIRQVIASCCIIVWSLRLGLFLFSRSLSENGIDSRFADLKKNIYSFTTAWTAQGLWVFLCSLPVYILNTSDIVSNEKASFIENIKLTDVIGLSVFLSGFLIESVADEQKRLFRIQNHSKKVDERQAFINTGLWSLSRHPNYFGEICVWIGLYILCSGGYHHPLQYIFGVISPIFIFTLLVFVSGIPLLEKASDKRWGSDEAYQKYKTSTPALIPFLGRKGSAMF